MTKMSWKMAIPSASRAPELAAIPMSWYIFTLIAVELSAQATATTTTCVQGSPKYAQVAAPAASMVTAICRPPPVKA